MWYKPECESHPCSDRCTALENDKYPKASILLVLNVFN